MWFWGRQPHVHAIFQMVFCTEAHTQPYQLANSYNTLTENYCRWFIPHALEMRSFDLISTHMQDTQGSC